MLNRFVAALAAVLLSASLAHAGKVPSQTIVPNPMQDGPAACDATGFDYDLNFSATLMVKGDVTNWYVLTGVNAENFAVLWNNVHPDSKVPEGIEFDAVIGLTDPSGSVTGEPGDYALLYLDGCFVDFIKAVVPPDNVSPPPGEVKVQWESLKQWQMFGYIGLR